MLVTVATAVGVVAVAGVPVLLDVTNPPSSPVTELLNSSADGSEAKLASWFAHEQTADALPQAPRDSQYAAPSNVRVLDVVKGGYNDAEVTVFYAVGDAHRTETVPVIRGGLFAAWRIDAPPSVLHIETDWPTTVRVAGVNTEPGAVLVAPGAYKTEIRHDLFTAESQTAIVGIAGGHVELDPKLHADAVRTAAKAINAHIDTCAASQEELSLQSDCPFFETRPRIPAPTSVSWSISEYPAFGLKPDGDELRIDTTASGEAVLRMEYDKRETKTYTCRFNVDGALTVNGADMSWTGNAATNLDGCERK